MSHTPAPWKIGGKYKSDIYGNNGLTAVARSFMSNIGEHERNANTHLIAAAPELLEALKLFIKAGIGNSTDFEIQRNALKLGLSAKVKAEVQE